MEMGYKQGYKPMVALDKYCELSALEVEEQIFCYNAATIRKDITRLIEMGADEFRVCKKVRSINPDFCKGKSTAQKHTNTGIQLNDRKKRGIIYI
jgi:hypothetical protein